MVYNRKGLAFAKKNEQVIRTLIYKINEDVGITWNKEQKKAGMR